DLAEPSEVADQVALGDAWWSRASLGVARNLHQRAGHWYLRALPHLAAVERTRIEEKLRTLALELPDSLEYVDWSQGSKQDDFVRLLGRQEIGTRWLCSGPFEATAVARTNQHNIRFHGYRGSSVTFCSPVDSKSLRVTLPDGD